MRMDLLAWCSAQPAKVYTAYLLGGLFNPDVLSPPLSGLLPVLLCVTKENTAAEAEFVSEIPRALVTGQPVPSRARASPLLSAALRMGRQELSPEPGSDQQVTTEEHPVSVTREQIRKSFSKPISSAFFFKGTSFLEPLIKARSNDSFSFSLILPQKAPKFSLSQAGPHFKPEED